MRLQNIYKILLPALLLTVLLAPAGCRKTEVETVPVVTISSVNKKLLRVGDTLVIGGAHFNATASKNLVAVASVAYTVISASDAELRVLVPENAQSGQLTVGFAGGQATSYTEPLIIVGSTEPYIESITPDAAYENDTIFIRGGNFATPFDRNSVMFNGTYAGAILNASENELQVLVPELASEGVIQVTTNGISSQPFPYKIAKVDPYEDGVIHWLQETYEYSSWGAAPFRYMNISRGLPQNKSLPQAAALYSSDKPLLPKPQNPWSVPAFYPLMSPGENAISFMFNTVVVSDVQRNAYYLTASAFPFPAEYTLMKRSGTDAAAPVWNKLFDEPGVYTAYHSPDYPQNPANIHYAPVKQLAIDGNTLYIKMGMSDDYYVADLSASTPVVTLQKNVFGDSSAFNIQFGSDYLFYGSVGSMSYSQAPDGFNGFRFARKGSKVSELIPMNENWGVDSYPVGLLADPAHGNEALIFVKKQRSQGSYTAVFKFNADTRSLVLLYDFKNWPDSFAPNATVYESGSGIRGFLWAGHHIYYANATKSTQYSSLRRINDNDAQAKPYVVYGRMEPSTSDQGTLFNLFFGK